MMEDFISSTVASFSNFLSENNFKIKDHSPSNLLVSYVTIINDFNVFERINHLTKSYERSFYFEKPDENFFILGADEALIISENGERRFTAIDKRIKGLKGSFINNWGTTNVKDIPLFLGGMKFMTDHNDTDWQDYDDSTWFIPEIMILCAQEQKYLFFNFNIQGTLDKEIVKKFRVKLEKFLKPENSKEKLSVQKILNSNGDSPKDKKKWKQLVEEALERISENHIEKVVLARKVELNLASELDFNSIIAKLRNNHPNCSIFIYHHGRSSFFGATPELLAKFSGSKIEIDVLAGSAPRSKNSEEENELEKSLLADHKNLHEHDIVTDHIKRTLNKSTENLNIEKQYSIKKLANIQHIWSRISAFLPPTCSMMNLLKELYPTPAICGFPKETALHFIKKSENFRRGLYSGIIGWFNLEENGEFVVALRSALAINNKIIAFAGNGIVDDSNPETEFKETELKLKTILSLFND
ncbi:MAG: isochorismate synthase [Ignavibacteriaceae bacterium]